MTLCPWRGRVISSNLARTKLLRLPCLQLRTKVCARCSCHYVFFYIVFLVRVYETKINTVVSLDCVHAAGSLSSAKSDVLAISFRSGVIYLMNNCFDVAPRRINTRLSGGCCLLVYYLKL